MYKNDDYVSTVSSLVIEERIARVHGRVTLRDAD